MNDREKILIVDDTDLVRITLRLFLEELDFEVFEAPDGRSALEACLAHAPDLVLLDFGLPDMDGTEVCKQFKQMQGMREVPVLFISALMDTESILRAFQAGAADYVIKPFRTEEVEARVRMHLELQSKRRLLEKNQQDLLRALFDTKMLNEKLVEINERLRQSETVKTRFLDHMRNEFNNPLSVIQAVADELELPDLPHARIREVGQIIKGEALQLDFRIKNVFCAAELEAGETTRDIAHTDVRSILSHGIQLFTPLAQAKQLQIQFPGWDGTSDLFCNTDAAKLDLIFQNLLANAIEFSPPQGRVEIQASLEADQLKLSIRDQGIGIPRESHEHIFERFRQLDSGLTRAHLGQGLGLSVVKALAEFLGGFVQVESQPGQGSCFTCILPDRTSSNPDRSGLEGNLFFFDEPHEL